MTGKIGSVLLLTSIAFCNCFAATSSCAPSQEETSNGTCYSLIQGSTNSPALAYHSIALPEGWLPADGLVIFNHGLDPYLEGFEDQSHLKIYETLVDGYFTADVQPNPSLGPFADAVISQGFAMAASSYTQTGWAVFDSHLANKALYQEFLSHAGATPQKLYFIGGSLGGIVTMRDMEDDRLPEIPEARGALLLCGAVAGAVNWYQAYDLRMVYDAVCKRTGDDLPSPWYKIPTVITGELEALESIDSCTSLGLKYFYYSTIPNPFLAEIAWRAAADDEQEDNLQKLTELTGIVEDWLPTNIAYATFELPRLINWPSKLNGVNPFGNVGVDYKDAAVNYDIARRVVLPTVRDQLFKNYTPNGIIGATNVVSIHTSRDGLVRPENQNTLLSMATLPSNQLTVAVKPETQASHCGFTEAEGVGAWNALLNWTEPPAGVQPDHTDINPAFLPPTVLGGDLLTFSRENLATVQGNNTFDANTGLLAVEKLQIERDDNVFDGVLQWNGDLTNPEFLVISATRIARISFWQHGALYDPDEELLYIPKVLVSNMPPPHHYLNGRRLDVYMEPVVSDLSVLRPLEIE